MGILERSNSGPARWWPTWAVPLRQVDSRGLREVCEVTVSNEEEGLQAAGNEEESELSEKELSLLFTFFTGDLVSILGTLYFA